MAKILLVDDNPQNIELLSLRLDSAGHDTLEARDGEQALKLVHDHGPDLMILDLQMPKVDGLQVLKTLQEERLDIPVVVISAFATVERAVEAMKAGALDFITKPFDPTHLELVVERALERKNLENQNRFLTEELNARYHFVMGHSEGMIHAYEAMVRVAQKSDPVLIEGEGGTGKEIAARLIHKESDRAGGPFVTVRCSTLAPDQMEAELFGYRGKKGRVELAGGGVLFLDEVGRLTPEVQDKLAGMLKTHGFTRKGGDTLIPADVRVICATTADLSQEGPESPFSEKLLGILSKHVIHLPPLRDRPEDIPELVSYFVEKFNREVGKDLIGASEEALESLASYPWPGNVRELANIIERAVSTGKGDMIEPVDLGIAVRGLVAERVQGNEPPVAGTYHEQLMGYRRRIVMAALRESDGEIGKAAEVLGLPEKTVKSLLGVLGIRR